MKLTHFDSKGNAVMVNVSEKDITLREAIAEGYISMSKECFEAVQSGSAGKGNILGVAQIAGIMAAKRTSELIPLCHPLNLTNTGVEFILHSGRFEVSAVCTVQCKGNTGVEMDALTGVSVALLTIYDMCKAIDKSMVIGGIHLVKKTGGKSGSFQFEEKKA